MLWVRSRNTGAYHIRPQLSNSQKKKTSNCCTEHLQYPKTLRATLNTVLVGRPETRIAWSVSSVQYASFSFIIPCVDSGFNHSGWRRLTELFFKLHDEHKRACKTLVRLYRRSWPGWRLVQSESPSIRTMNRKPFAWISRYACPTQGNSNYKTSQVPYSKRLSANRDALCRNSGSFR